MDKTALAVAKESRFSNAATVACLEAAARGYMTVSAPLLLNGMFIFG